ncbi:MAG: DUF4271 domain-containing protein [Prevotellaceae bacterium]|jgi:hypothetical protein|nr:DUF4271 domain-containing protein [Prevotellaceae bacterium]
MPENFPYIDTTAVASEGKIPYLLLEADNPLLALDSVRAQSSLKFYTVKDTEKHHLNGKDGQTHPFALHAQSWLTLLFVLLFFVYAYNMIRFRKFWTEQTKGLLKIKERMSFFADSSLKDIRQTLYLTFIAFANLAILLYISVATFYPNPAANNRLVLVFFAIVYIFYIAKLLVLRFLGFVFFNNQSTAMHFRNSHFALISMFGILLYINNLILVYATFENITVFLVLGGILCLIFALFKSFLILKYFCSQFVSYLYFILYLCTLEILPIIALIQILVEVERTNLLTEWITKL